MIPARRCIPGVRRTLLVASGKGGVGKSTVSANIAFGLARAGHQVGLLDADIYGPSVPRLLGLTGTKIATNTDQLMVPTVASHGDNRIKCMSMGFLVDQSAPIVWRGLMVMKAIQQLLWQVKWDPLDYLVIDMPPGTGDTQLTISQQLEASGALIVTTPQELALSDARRALAMFEKVKVPVIGYVKNMASFRCTCCGKASRIFPEGEALSKTLTKLAELPLNPETAQNSEMGQPSDIALFDSLTGQIINKLS